MIKRASATGFLMPRTFATAPARRSLPSMIDASSSCSPCALNTAPLPALKSGESSSRRTASSTTSRPAAPAASMAAPAASTSASAARIASARRASRPSSRAAPAPPWTASDQRLAAPRRRLRAAAASGGVRRRFTARAGTSSELRAYDRGAGRERRELAERDGARQVLHAAIGRRDQALGRQHLERRADPRGHLLRRLDVAVVQVEHADQHCFRRQRLQDGEVETRLRGFDRDLLRRALLELLQERIAARRLALDERGIAEAQVQRGRAGDPRERAVDRLDAIAARVLGAGLEPRLVELHHVGTGGEEIANLLVH